MNVASSSTTTGEFTGDHNSEVDRNGLQRMEIATDSLLADGAGGAQVRNRSASRAVASSILERCENSSFSHWGILFFHCIVVYVCCAL